MYASRFTLLFIVGLLPQPEKKHWPLKPQPENIVKHSFFAVKVLVRPGDLWGLMRSVLRGSGGILGRSWRGLERSGEVLGGLGGSQGVSGGVLRGLGGLLFFWALLGPSWGCLGAVLGASWWPTWPQLGS